MSAIFYLVVRRQGTRSRRALKVVLSEKEFLTGCAGALKAEYFPDLFLDRNIRNAIFDKQNNFS